MHLVAPLFFVIKEDPSKTMGATLCILAPSMKGTGIHCSESLVWYLKVTLSVLMNSSVADVLASKEILALEDDEAAAAAFGVSPSHIVRPNCGGSISNLGL